MKYYIVPDASNPTKYAIIGASGFTPPNSLGQVTAVDAQGNIITDVDVLDIEDDYDAEGNLIGKKADFNPAKKAAKDLAKRNADDARQLQDQKNQVRKMRMDQWIKDLKSSTTLEEVKGIVKDLLRETLKKDEP